MVEPIGKGMFIWQVDKTSGGILDAIIQKLLAGGFTWVQVKLTDGTFEYKPVDSIAEFIRLCKQVGIDVWGWGYSYGSDPIKEAEIAAKTAEKHGISGFLGDMEMEWDVAGMENRATKYCETYQNLTSIPLWLCSFRFPNVHPQFPWKTFEKYVEGYVPQVYWQGAHNPANQIAQCILQHRAFTQKPIIPAGSAYSYGDWVPTVSDFREFNDTVKVKGIPALTWWVMQIAERNGEWWSELASHSLDDEGAGGGGGDTGYQYRVLAESLFVRSTPDNENNDNVIGRLKYNDIVTVDARSGEWLRIAGYGWISVGWVIPCGEEIPYTEPETPPVGQNVYRVVSGTNKLNVREGPGKSFNLVYQLENGEYVTVSKSENGWAQLSDGYWCYGIYLEKVVPAVPALTLEERVQRLERAARDNGWNL